VTIAFHPNRERFLDAIRAVPHSKTLAGGRFGVLVMTTSCTQ